MRLGKLTRETNEFESGQMVLVLDGQVFEAILSQEGHVKGSHITSYNEIADCISWEDIQLTGYQIYSQDTQKVFATLVRIQSEFDYRPGPLLDWFWVPDYAVKRFEVGLTEKGIEIDKIDDGPKLVSKKEW